MSSKNTVKKMMNYMMRDKWIWIIIILLFVERFLAASTVGITYNIESDDLSYIVSGIEFANTGKITMHGVLSAQIMPGMPVLIGVISLVFGEGRMLWFALKILWFLLGSLTALYIYKSVNLFAPKWCGVIAALPLFGADFVWMDNLILTETPFMFFFVVMIYETLMMGKSQKGKHFWLCALAYMASLMFKANIGVYPIFAMFYLLLIKYDFKRLLKQGVLLGCMILCFVIPWSVRNYIHYDAFVPLTWGSGNPLLLGTYQGVGYPSDEELDYKTNVDMVMEEQYSEYYNDKGKVKEEYLEKYLALEKDKIKAKYRMKEWFKDNPLSMIESYLFLKPKAMIESVFYWEPLTIFGEDGHELILLRDLNFWLCILTIFAAFYLKKYRALMIFFLIVYLGNIYIYAMTFSFSRYAATLMPIRYMIIGVGGYLIIKLLGKIKKSIEEFEHT